MKCLKLNREQINALSLMLKGDAQLLKLNEYVSPQGDKLVLMADRVSQDGINILWVKDSVYRDKVTKMIDAVEPNYYRSSN